MPGSPWAGSWLGSGRDRPLVALAGGLGAAARYCVDTAVQRLVSGPLPVGTLAVNVSGSFLLGVLTATLADGATALAVVGIGFCGGYTTFGTAMVQTWRLAGRRLSVVALVNHVGGAAVCLLAAAAGFVVGR